MSPQFAEPGITRIVPWKQGLFTGAAGTHEVPVARYDDVVGHVYLGPDQPSGDHRAVEHCLLRRIVLLPFDMRNERVRRIGGGDLIPSLELQRSCRCRTDRD